MLTYHYDIRSFEECPICGGRLWLQYYEVSGTWNADAVPLVDDEELLPDDDVEDRIVADSEPATCHDFCVMCHTMFTVEEYEV